MPHASELSALFLDAGNTVVFLDTDVVASVAEDAGVRVSAATLSAVEGAAKRRYEEAMVAGGKHEGGFRLYLTTLLTEAGVSPDRARDLLTPLRAAHDELNLWRRVPDDLPAALERARGLGLRLGIISNSEGKLPELFARVGLGDAFEIVIDSAHEGIAKPDPEIFLRAAQRMGISPHRGLHAGDIPAIDVEGALSAGMHAALIDPLDFYPAHDRSPRHASVSALVASLTHG